MINSEYIFDNLDSMRAVWVDDGVKDTSDLACIVSGAIDGGAVFMSVSENMTRDIWPWIENQDVKILNRFNFTLDGVPDVSDAISGLAAKITAAFKSGADGAQIFINHNDLRPFAEFIAGIKGDLFFNKYCSVALDIDKMSGVDWANIFTILGRLNPDSVLITASGESFDASSGFVGVVYDMLHNWNIDAGLHLMFGNNMFRVCQTVRLAQKIKPELVDNMRVFMRPSLSER